MTGFYMKCNTGLKWVNDQYFHHIKTSQFVRNKARLCVCVSGDKNFFFGKFGVLCFLVTPVLGFAFFPYCRRTDLQNITEHMTFPNLYIHSLHTNIPNSVGIEAVKITFEFKSKTTSSIQNIHANTFAGIPEENYL